MKTRPSVLVTSGLDPSGKAGLLADVATIERLGAHALGVATALTAQGERTFLVHRPPTHVLRAQVKAVLELERRRIRAIKTGMVTGPAAMDALAELLLPLRIPWVIDPVVGTSKGQLLSRLRPGDFLRLAQPHVILTPNVIECGWLAGERTATNVTEAAAQGARLQARGFRAVIVKGGHLRGDPVDLICTKDAVEVVSAPRLPRSKLHHRGTGCRFASALATRVAQGMEISAAVRDAKVFVESYLRTL